MCACATSVPSEQVFSKVGYIPNHLRAHLSPDNVNKLDDVVLYRAIHSVADHDISQQDLHSLTQWAKTWQMAFNLCKCELLRITNKQNPSRYCYYMNGEEVRSVSNAKYLGVILDEHLTFNEHI